MTAVRRRIPQLTLIEHEFAVPLDHDHPGGEPITVFAREVIGDSRGAESYPLLVFFQGGPGSEAPRTPSAPADGSWLKRALQEFRVLMLDQRGTGRSTPVGTLAGLDPQAQADYLTHFRADSIVRDARSTRRIGSWMSGWQQCALWSGRPPTRGSSWQHSRKKPGQWAPTCGG